MSHRNLEYLHRNRIIYRGYPENDEPTDIYWWGSYYEDGTYECYELFRSTAKITTFRSLKWHLSVLWWLNPNIDRKKFRNLSQFICDKSNGFITFTIPSKTLDNLINSFAKTKKPPKNKLRKIIFKPNLMIDISEKLKIVGSLIGRGRISRTDIYEWMLNINSLGQKITIAKLANCLKCSSRTIHRHMSDELKNEKEQLNNMLDEKV